MKKSQVKRIIKEIVKEIYQREEIPDDPYLLFSKIIRQDPTMTDPSKAQLFTNQILDEIVNAFENSMRGLMGKSEEIISTYSNRYTKGMIELTNFLKMWGQNILEMDYKQKDEVVRILKEIQNHTVQITNQINQSSTNIIQWQNYINARKQIEHVKEIFVSLKESINELFELAKRYQYEE